MHGQGVFDDVPYFGDALNNAGNDAIDAAVPLAKKYGVKAARYVGRKLGIPGAGVGKKRKMKGNGLFGWIPGGIGNALDSVGNAALGVAAPVAQGLATKALLSRFGGGVGKGVNGYGINGYGVSAPHGGKVGRKGRKGKKGNGILGGVLGSLLPF